MRKPGLGKMNAEELRHKLEDEFGLNSWPQQYKVDAETYAKVCQSIFSNSSIKSEGDIYDHIRGIVKVKIALGPHDGIMFKNIELILK